MSFQRVDMYRDLPIGEPDLVVSADFLEHLAPETLPEILRRIDSLSSKAFHKIACYDDGHIPGDRTRTFQEFSLSSSFLGE